MVLEQPFTTASPFLANYSYTELASGEGFITFFGAGMETASGKILKLTPNTILDFFKVSEEKDHTRAATSSASFIELISLSFQSSPFNLPRNIKGDMIVNVPFSIRTSSGTSDPHMKITAEIFKNTTSLASETSEEFQGIGTGNISGEFVFPITIPLTNIAVGDTIKIEIKGFMKRSGDVVSIGGLIGYNTQNTAIIAQDESGSEPEKLTLTNSQMRFEIPFLIPF